MRLKSRLERLERRLQGGSGKLAMRRFLELLGRVMEGETLSSEEDRELEALEQQLPLARRQLLAQCVRQLDEPAKTVEEMIMAGLPTVAQEGLSSGEKPG